jgi:hypothetical protein
MIGTIGRVQDQNSGGSGEKFVRSSDRNGESQKAYFR